MQVIVMTSDNQSHCLVPFMYLWRKFFTGFTPGGMWADRDGYHPGMPIDLVFCGFTEPKIDLRQFDNWRFHSIGKFEDYPADKWSDAFLHVLDNVAQDRFILMLEDYWLCRPVDVRGVKYLYDYMAQFQNVLKIDLDGDRLYINGGSNFLYNQNTYNYVGHLDLLKSPSGTAYQFSLWGGIWRRDLMRKYIIPGRSAQELELQCSDKVGDDVLVLGTRQMPLHHANIYRSGRGKTPAFSEGGWSIPDSEIEYMKGKGWI